MRKITSLLMLLCVFVGTAWAQVQITSIESLTGEEELTFSTSGRGGWAVNADRTQFGSTNDYGFGTTVNYRNDQHVFQLKKNEGSLYLFSVYAQKYVNPDRSLSETATNALTYVEQGDGTFVFKFSDDKIINIGGSNQMTIDNWGSGTWTGSAESEYDAGNKITIMDVTEARNAKVVTVTYNYYIGGQLYTSQAMEVNANSEVEVPAQAFLTVVNYEGTIGEENCEITVNCTENLPFVVTADLKAPVWQVVEMHRYGTFRVWDYVENDADIKVTEMSSTKEDVSDDSKLWCFTGNLIDGFKIYNKLAGTTVTLNATATTAKVGTAVDGNDVWKLKASTATSDPAACFTHDGSNCMNQQDGFIKYWSSADNGSTCYFFNPSAKVLEAASAFDGIPQGAVGSYNFTEEQKGTFVAAVNAVVENPNDLAKTKALSDLIKQAKKLDKVAYADGYYRIYSAQPGLYAKSKGLIFNGSTFSWGTVSNNGLNAIVKLTTDNEKVVLQNVNSELYMQGVAGASNAAMSENGHITLTELGDAQYNLQFGNGTMHANGHGSGAGELGSVIAYDGGYGSASAWYIIPATELEITVGAAGYSTTYLPFDVTVPNTVKAYAVTATSQTYATLTEMTSIPANQGAILEGEGTHTFAIAKATSDWSQNKLAGTNVNSYVNANAYVLANDDEGVALYKATLNKNENGENGETHFLNNANKAYLPASAVPAGARFLSFDFGTETAIESIEGAENAANAVIYDLSGRRVQKAQKGLYIVNGVKVIK